MINNENKIDYRNNNIANIAKYWPLIALVLVSLLISLAINSHLRLNHNGFMHYFMGIFLCIFSLLKIFDLQGFAKGFQKYDLLAKRFVLYAFIYPFIELSLGLLYLAFIYTQFTCIATIIITIFGCIGVVQGMRSGLKIDCPCMGSILKVPLSTVTLTENLSMMLMAAFMLI